jgi:hypothetical protein
MKSFVAIFVAISSLLLMAQPAFVQEYVQFPATGAWCEYDAYGTCWCYLENEQMWTRVNPNWMYVPLGG